LLACNHAAPKTTNATAWPYGGMGDNMVEGNHNGILEGMLKFTMVRKKMKCT